MKKLAAILGLVVLGLGSGCLENPIATPESFSGTLLRWHFVGSAAVARNTNAAKLKVISALPSTVELRDQILQKLARTPREIWKKDLPAAAGDQAALIRPLLDDLLSAESFFESRGPAQRAETVWGVQLNDERAQLWQTNLGRLMAAWNLGTPQEQSWQGFKGWDLKGSSATRHFQFVRAGTWVLMQAGHGGTNRLPALLQQVARTGRPVPAANTWLEAEADFPRLHGWFPFLAKWRLPAAQLTLSGRGGSLRTEAQLRYSNPVPYQFEPWKIPTNAIRDPLISFTVGRGIAPLLSRVTGVPELGLKDLPGQFCLWAQGTHHVRSYASMPVTNPTNFLKTLAPQVSTLVRKHLVNPMGDSQWNTNTTEITWRDIPFIVPYLRPAMDSGAGYVMAGLLLPPRSTNRPPPELYSQFINRKDVLYYDWEITAERLPHSGLLYQLWNLVNRQRLPSTNVLSQKWLLEVAPHLFNTITELTMKSPKELSLVRRSDLGLTGFELVTLTRWIDSPGFPLTFESPPLMSSLANRPTASRTNSPPGKKPVR